MDGESLGELEIYLQCQLDSRGQWLAIHNSSFKVSLLSDRTPLFRFEYVRAMSSAPCAHVQVHAQRGALSHLLSQARHASPHEMASLHLPFGGARFRPCLEDVIQFLVRECRIDCLDGWERAVENGRAAWRSKQARAVTRDYAQGAAETLRTMGYEVCEPDEVPSRAAGAMRW